MDYLGLKAQEAALASELTAWRRKVEIVELAARQAAARAYRGGTAASTTLGGLRGGGGAAPAFGSSAPLARGGATAGTSQPLAKSAAVGGRVGARGIGGFGGALFSARSGTYKSGTLHLGLPPAVRGGR